MKVFNFKDAHWFANAERKSLNRNNSINSFWRISNTFSQNLSFCDLETSSKGMHLDHSMHPFLTVIESFRMQKDGDFS